MKNINMSEMFVDDELKAAALDVLESGRYIKGPRVREFEEKFSHFIKAQYAVATSSGTTALFTAYLGLGLKPGDEVIVPSHTFIATATPFMFLGAKPVFVDIEPETYTMDPEQVKKKITTRTKAIVPVHMYGHPAELQPIMELAQQYGLKVVEDSCQAHGATYQNQNVGDIGDVAVFSYFPSKNMTVAGDGGMIVTNNGDLADKLRLLRNHGRTDPATSDLLGLNFRMSEIHAAIGLVQLKHLPDWIEKRRAAAAHYTKLFKKSGLVDKKIILPIERQWAKHVYHLYVIRVLGGKRDNLRQHLKDHGIASGIHYAKALHEQPCILDYLQNNYNENLSTIRASLTNTKKILKEILSLPIYPNITKNDILYIVDTIKAYLNEV